MAEKAKPGTAKPTEPSAPVPDPAAIRGRNDGIDRRIRAVATGCVLPARRIGKDDGGLASSVGGCRLQRDGDGGNDVDRA